MLSLFFFSSVILFSSHFGAASDIDTLDGWIRDAASLGLGQTELGALRVLREILESGPTESARILGMPQGMGGMGGIRRADEAVLRRLNTINMGLNSARTRTLGAQLPEIALRAKKKLWNDGYDKETGDVDEDQDNAKRRVKLVLNKLEEGKESELFERIRPTDYRQLKEMDEAYSAKRHKDIMTDLSRKSVAELPGGLSQALKDAAEYVNEAYGNLAMGVSGAPDVPESVRKAIGVMKEVKEGTRDDGRVLGLLGMTSTTTAARDYNTIDEALMRRMDAMNLTDENVLPLRGLVASFRSKTLKRLNVAYEELGKTTPQYRAVQDAINVMKAMENTVYDLDTFGMRTDPVNPVAFDAEYFTRANAISKRNGNVRRHFGLRRRMEEAIRKLNGDFDSVLRRKSTLLTGEPRTLWEKLAEIDAKPDQTLFGIPRDIEGLDAEYTRRVHDIDTNSESLRQYRGLKLRVELAKERLSRAYFLVADKLGIPNKSATHPDVQKALTRSSEILSKYKWNEMLGKPEMTVVKIEEAYRRGMEELNRDKSEVRKLPGLVGALEVVANELGLARQILIETVRPPKPGPGGLTPEQEARARLEELAKEFDNRPPQEISDSCRDEAPNCHENFFLCKNEYYVSLMHSWCKRTCKVCMQSAEAAHCEDRNAQDCQLWGQSFCTSPIYPKGMKMQHCAKYCGLCPRMT